MTKIYFISGFIGSGKTTYAHRLADSTCTFRFSMDEWMIPLYGEHMQKEIFDAGLATLQVLFKKAALQMIQLGVSVIFDFGFWTKADRQSFVCWASEHGIGSEVHYLDVAFAICKERATIKNLNVNKSLHIPRLLQYDQRLIS